MFRIVCHHESGCSEVKCCTLKLSVRRLVLQSVFVGEQFRSAVCGIRLRHLFRAGTRFVRLRCFFGNVHAFIRRIRILFRIRIFRICILRISILRFCILRLCIFRIRSLRLCILRFCILRFRSLRLCILRFCILRFRSLRLCILRLCILRLSILRLRRFRFSRFPQCRFGSSKLRSGFHFCCHGRIRHTLGKCRSAVG